MWITITLGKYFSTTLGFLQAYFVKFGWKGHVQCHKLTIFYSFLSILVTHFQTIVRLNNSNFYITLLQQVYLGFSMFMDCNLYRT